MARGISTCCSQRTPQEAEGTLSQKLRFAKRGLFRLSGGLRHQGRAMKKNFHRCWLLHAKVIHVVSLANEKEGATQVGQKVGPSREIIYKSWPLRLITGRGRRRFTHHRSSDSCGSVPHFLFWEGGRKNAGSHSSFGPRHLKQICRAVGV